MKRLKTVLRGLYRANSATTGRTRSIHDVRHGVSSANTFCMSTHRWAVDAVGGPKRSELAMEW